MEFIKWGQKQVRQFALNLTETEVRVEEATNNDPWGPHGSDMSKIAEDALDSEKYREIMTVIARRLTDTGENWRHVYKALLLLEHLVKHGPTKVARDTLANSTILHQLQSFEFKDKTGRDYGLNVRNRSKELLTLVSDAQKLSEAREVARVNRNKFRGASRENARFMSNSPPPSFSQTLPKRVVYEEKEEKNEAVDPFEATRKRIEKLKANENQNQPAAAIKVTLPQQQKREPKKLSQVKMNPEIAATFLKPQNQTTTPPSQTTTLPPPPATDDLIGDLSLDTTPQPVEETRQTEEPVGNVQDMFDVLTAPVVASAEVPLSGNDEWADFNDGNKPSAQPEILLTDLLSQDQGVPTVPGPAPVKAAPAPADPFASLCVTSQKPAMVPMGVNRAPMPPAQPQPPMQSMPNGFTMDTTASQWTSAAVKQPAVMPGVGFVMNGVVPMGTASSGGTRQPGAPMNPNAVQPLRGQRKEDPFANLGF